jgi:hypothetical protein
MEIERRSIEYKILMKKSDEESKILYENKLEEERKLFNLKMNEFETEKIQMKKENEAIKIEKQILEESLKNLEVKLKLEKERISSNENKDNFIKKLDLEKQKFIGELTSLNCNCLIIMTFTLI